MKNTLLIAFCFMSLLSSAFAVDLVGGTFRGETVHDDKLVELHLRSYPGRPGSFLAILIKDKKIGFPYLVDKFAENKYGMIPLEPLENGVIGMKDYDPSLVLSIVLEKNKYYLRIVDNNSNNRRGFREAMKIRYKQTHRHTLTHFIPGTFKFDGIKNAATLSHQDQNSEAALTLNFGGEHLNGDFLLRTVRPSLHLAFRSSLSGTGTLVEERTSHMVFFLHGHCFFRHDYMVLMATDGTLTYMARR